MFNQRPSTLDWRDASTLGETNTYWSPTFPSPQDVIKALDDVWRDYYIAYERPLQQLQQTPSSAIPPTLPSHLTAQQQSQQQHHHNHQSQAPTHQSIQAPALQVTRQLHLPVQLQPPGQTQIQLIQQQQQQQPHESQQPQHQQPQQPLAQLTNQQAPIILPANQPQQHSQQQQQQQQQPQQPTPQPESQIQPIGATSKPRRLTDEEKLRHKRERNRRAAANCRRRKDEKLKSLQDENAELRKTIENLQAALESLQNQLRSFKLESS